MVSIARKRKSYRDDGMAYIGTRAKKGSGKRVSCHRDAVSSWRRKPHASFARRVYHATERYFDTPDTKHSRPPTDFGSGFYTTPDKEYAMKHMWRRGVEQFIIIGYVFDDEAAKLDQLKILEFKLDEAWLDFIMWNRTGISDRSWPDYDIAIGPSADHEIVGVVDWYASCIRSGIYISPERVIRMLKPHQASQQILFHSERSLRYLKEIKDA